MNSRLTTRLLLLLLLTILLHGCGQKGPLYLPDKPKQPTETENSESPDS
jgi:predicted small lipoprotein YifL